MINIVLYLDITRSHCRLAHQSTHVQVQDSERDWCNLNMKGTWYRKASRG